MRKLRYIARKRNIWLSPLQSQNLSEIFLSLLFLVQRRKDIPSRNVFKFLSLKIKQRWFEQGKRQAKLICVNVILMSDFYSDIRHFLRRAGISNTLSVSFSTNSWYRLKIRRPLVNTLRSISKVIRHKKWFHLPLLIVKRPASVSEDKC